RVLRDRHGSARFPTDENRDDVAKIDSTTGFPIVLPAADDTGRRHYRSGSAYPLGSRRRVDSAGDVHCRGRRYGADQTSGPLGVVVGVPAVFGMAARVEPAASSGGQHLFQTTATG